LRSAHEAFLTSTTRNVMPIARVDTVALATAPGPLTAHAAEVFARHAAESPDP
jgi:branched-chain amino acid aminotransferase